MVRFALSGRRSRAWILLFVGVVDNRERRVPADRIDRMSEVLVADRVAVALAGAHARSTGCSPRTWIPVPTRICSRAIGSWSGCRGGWPRSSMGSSRRSRRGRSRSSAGAASTRAFVRQFLRLHPGEAAARVQAAEAAGPQRTLTGEALEPIYSRVAAAQAAGEISPRHAAVVVKAVETLPAAVAAEHGARVEADLVDYASGFDDGFDPHQLAILAHRMHACLDPDGATPRRRPPATMPARSRCARARTGPPPWPGS